MAKIAAEFHQLRVVSDLMVVGGHSLLKGSLQRPGVRFALGKIGVDRLPDPFSRAAQDKQGAVQGLADVSRLGTPKRMSTMSRVGSSIEDRQASTGTILDNQPLLP